MDKYLFVPSKIDYVKGVRPDVDCILCSIRDNDDRVSRLVVHESDHFVICLNLFPYNVGHVMIFPVRHVEDYSEMTEEENSELFRLTKKTLSALDEAYSPEGYNLGWNLGVASGATISHIHLHIVPRYKNELGFIDIIGKSKVMVDLPDNTCAILKEKFSHE